MSPFGARRIISCWQGQKRLNEGIFAVLSHDSRELKIVDFLVTQIPVHTGAPHMFTCNKPSNFDLCVAFIRRVADDLRCSKRVTRITHDKSNVGML